MKSNKQVLPAQKLPALATCYAGGYFLVNALNSSIV
jgi:hypothetical protein